MKRLFLLACIITALSVSSQAQTGSYNAALGSLDTLTNADTTTYTLSVAGAKHMVGFQVNLTKISGTVAGTIKIYGSMDGTNYGTTAAASDTLVNASNVYQYKFDKNYYTKYKVQIITSGTVSCSQTTWALYRTN